MKIEYGLWQRVKQALGFRVGPTPEQLNAALLRDPRFSADQARHVAHVKLALARDRRQNHMI